MFAVDISCTFELGRLCGWNGNFTTSINSGSNTNPRQLRPVQLNSAPDLNPLKAKSHEKMISDK